MPTMEELVRKSLRSIKGLSDGFLQVKAQQEVLFQMFKARPKSITEEIDSIPGRRIFYTLSDRIDFSADDDGLRGEPLSYQVSQDGPFVMTHYPIAAWKPNAPDSATNFGQWSPVRSWPLSGQQNTDQDRIDLSYEFMDGGSQRNFQNEAVGPALSAPDNFVPLPVPTLFSPNSNIQIFPTYENILFDSSGTPTTGGELWIGLLGYRIVNL
jgi:hypothetical protein